MFRSLQKLFGPMGAGGGAFLLAIATVLSNLLGWARDAMFVRVFGTTAATDSYFKAFLLPDTLLTIFVTGALLGLLIPLYVRAQQISKAEGERVFGTFFFSLNGLYGVAALFCLFFLRPLSAVMFPDTPLAELPVLVNLTAILLGANFFFALSNFLGHFLLAHKRFFSYAIAPLVYNVGIILGIYFGHEQFGIYAAAFGGLLGALLHFLSRLGDFFMSSERFAWNIDFKNKFFLELLRGLWPKVIALLSLQIGFYFFARLGDALLPEGSYSAFQYARNLQSFVVVLAGVSLATAVFPFLSEFAAAKKMPEFMFRLEKSMRQILFLSLPASLGMALMAAEIVRMTYGQGAGNALTIMVLIPLALAIPFESLQHLTVRAFHGLKSTLLPMVSSLLFLFILIGGSALLVRQFGFGISALGISYLAAFFVQFLFLQYFLERIAHISFPWGEFGPKFLKTLFLTLLMSLVVLGLQRLLVDMNFLLRLLIPVTAGGAIFLGGAFLWNSPELAELPFRRWLKLEPKKAVSVEEMSSTRTPPV